MNSSKNNRAYNKLKELRTNHDISSKEMSERLGISKAFYSQIENRTRRLSYDIEVKIDNILKLKPDKIFYEESK